MTSEAHIKYLNGEVARLRDELLKERTERTRLLQQLLAAGGRAADRGGPERMDSILAALAAPGQGARRRSHAPSCRGS